jgi:protein TonB
LLVIAGIHLLLVWALVQRDAVMVVLRHPASPLNVILLTEAAPPPTVAPPPRAAQALPPSPAWLPPPEVTVAGAPPTPPIAPVAPAAPPTVVAMAPAPVVADAAPAPPVRQPEAVAPTPPAPRQLPASAIRYRVPPAIEVPMASRRLGESGTVWLQVLVDAQGLPRQVSVHRSSGHPRLDEQAVAAMRQARFQPLSEGGATVEWRVIAPLLYELD